MNGLCHDREIHPLDGDNTCIGRDFLCSFHQKANIIGKTTDEFEDYVFISITNNVNQLSVGGCDGGIYGAEILHVVLLGLCKYIAEGIELTFTVSAMDLIYYVVVGIHQDSCRTTSVML